MTTSNSPDSPDSPEIASDTKPLNVRINSSLHERLRAEADRRVVGMGRIIEHLIDVGLHDLEKRHPVTNERASS